MRIHLNRWDPPAGHGIPATATRQRGHGGFLAVLLLPLLTLLSGCTDPQRPAVGNIGHVQGFAGAVTADEPRAALVARDVLSAGGSAADAAVALAFTMTVTNPAAGGLGGGGVCVIHDHDAKRTEALEFYPGSQPPPPPGATVRHPVAVPGLPRGLYALHAKYGRLRWESLLIPAEHLARFGDSVSRSLAYELTTSGAVLKADPQTRRIFQRADGGPLAEGDAIVHLDLAGTLSRLRVHGPGDLYAGTTSRELTAAVASVGGSMTREALRDYAPRWVPTLEVPFGNDSAHFAPPPAAGDRAGLMWAMLTTDDLTQSQEAPEARARLLTETEALSTSLAGNGGEAALPWSDRIAPSRIRQVLSAPRPGPLPSREKKAAVPSVSGFAIADRDGSMVACQLTMNAPFGTGILAPGTGMLLAAPLMERNGYGATPMLVVKRHVNEVVMAATTSGRGAATAPMLEIAVRTLLDRQFLPRAMAAPRPADSRINAIACIEGLPPFPGSSPNLF
ncbi:MAG: gamma-glutamyltransferase [Alphaproteobacteria bacterium]